MNIPFNFKNMVEKWIDSLYPTLKTPIDKQKEEIVSADSIG